MSMSEKLFLRKPQQFPTLACKWLATILLTACLLVQVPPVLVWHGPNLFAIMQREEINLIGYMAASLVLATFCMRSMSALRLIALASNLAFMAYGYLADLMPVLILHLVLFPVNAYRLLQLIRFDFRPSSRTPGARHP